MTNLQAAAEGRLIEISHGVAGRLGWSDEDRETVVDQYRTFLQRASVDPDLRPSILVDELWHQHILNTLSYTQYCSARFGRYIHHAPLGPAEAVVSTRPDADCTSPRSITPGGNCSSPNSAPSSDCTADDPAPSDDHRW